MLNSDRRFEGFRFVHFQSQAVLGNVTNVFYKPLSFFRILLVCLLVRMTECQMKSNKGVIANQKGSQLKDKVMLS
jgi:hypothetical protein